VRLKHLDMPVQGLNHYNLRAPRALLEELRAFYTEVIGLSVGPRPRFNSHGYWLYAGGDPILHLSEARPGSEPATGVPSTFNHAAFTCRDREAFEQHLGARGVSYRTEHVPNTGEVQLFLTDPAGNGVELNFADDARAPGGAAAPSV
jgi:catechol-2,3-dioxygenase